MLYPFMTYIDGTDIVFSDIFHKENDPRDYIRVEFERVNKNKDGFDSMHCILPDGGMTDIVGFTKEEADMHLEKIRDVEDVLFDCAREEEQKE